MKGIFITGASGCIGHYITESLIKETDHELFLLVRNPDKLKFDYQARSGIHLLQGDLQEIEKYRDLLSNQINIAILIATAWGGTTEAYDINVRKTFALLKMLNPEICEEVIYFSTASILDRNQQLLPEAEQYGTDYIRTKYQCFTKLSELEIAEKIIAVFPTLVVGGSENKPISHLSSGLPEVLRWIDLIRWLKADGSFHFIHAQDIATIVNYLVANPQINLSQWQQEIGVKKLVLGNNPTTINQAIAEICHYLNKRIYGRIPLSIELANFLIKVFKIQMDSWSRFSLEYRHFIYQNPVNPATFGLKNYCSTITDILKVSGIKGK
ncbi:NAD-dependent epimerase/dehydratase [Stanieria cyanosphaera PCC 7437]|uniref:NAD-dependent epimerase/dehydratase n=1 Tax=Stanieria cyanosphaera (strain ATCC 29371 / PCC 7437) TaxID=111780 RepID=K9XS17_STAC7|nr:NAD(P)-dependent oxidoreductase [Stanieria cyanosphaera]AFZ35400.1 NAD-dependent epimerase/dehydratase [Stanieria cyanosphaera PCC 7437]